jgi:hypothetical protein
MRDYKGRMVAGTNRALDFISKSGTERLPGFDALASFKAPRSIANDLKGSITRKTYGSELMTDPTDRGVRSNCKPSEVCRDYKLATVCGDLKLATVGNDYKLVPTLSDVPEERKKHAEGQFKSIVPSSYVDVRGDQLYEWKRAGVPEREKEGYENVRWCGPVAAHELYETGGDKAGVLCSFASRARVPCTSSEDSFLVVRRFAKEMHVSLDA